jgi:hypothetical protein
MPLDFLSVKHGCLATPKPGCTTQWSTGRKGAVPIKTVPDGVTRRKRVAIASPCTPLAGVTVTSLGYPAVYVPAALSSFLCVSASLRELFNHWPQDPELVKHPGVTIYSRVTSPDLQIRVACALLLGELVEPPPEGGELDFRASTRMYKQVSQAGDSTFTQSFSISLMITFTACSAGWMPLPLCCAITCVNSAPRMRMIDE